MPDCLAAPRLDIRPRRLHWQGAGLGVALAIAWGASPASAATVRLLLLAPLLEEIVLRAGLHEALLRRWPAHGRCTGHALAINAATACVFAAAHMVLRGGPLAALTAGPALLIGLVYQRWRRLIPCIALHALFNASWLLLSWARTSSGFLA